MIQWVLGFLDAYNLAYLNITEFYQGLNMLGDLPDSLVCFMICHGHFWDISELLLFLICELLV